MRGRAATRRLTSTGMGLALCACDPAAWLREDPGSPDGARDADVERLVADLGNSSIGFAVSRATSEHLAEFEDFTAVTVLEHREPTALDITIQMASIRSDRSGLTKHLQSADFFDVDHFPTATFAGTGFRPDPGEGRTHELTGKLELHGVQRSIVFPAQIRVFEKSATGVAELTIDPRDYGIDSPVFEEELVEPKVLLSIRLEFPRPGG